MDSSLTLEDFDWLRKIEAATDARRDPPPIPMNIAAKLGAFGFVKSNGLASTAKSRRIAEQFVGYQINLMTADRIMARIRTTPSATWLEYRVRLDHGRLNSDVRSGPYSEVREQPLF